MFISEELKRKIEDKVLECIEKAANHLPNLNWTIPEISYNLKSIRVSGRYINSIKTLVFNPLFINQNPENYILQTVPHEVAHYITRVINPFAKSHGNDWKRVMRFLGVEPKRCWDSNEYDSSEIKKSKGIKDTKYSYKCLCKVHLVSKIIHGKMQRGQIRRCVYCKTKLILSTEGV